jgi:bacteriophage N4 adsorption protein B
VPGEGLLFAQIALRGLEVIEHELLLFALFWFVIGCIDEIAIDLTWIWLRLTGRRRTPEIGDELGRAELGGRMAVLFPAWHEAAIIGATIRHTLSVWRQRDLRIYVGCYANDRETIAAVVGAAGGDERLRLIVVDRVGPTTKADCLNRLYAALCDDEARSGVSYRGVVIHDSEDMVDPAGLALIDLALGGVDFVQLPVRPEPQAGSRWIAGHYGDEFVESHAKAMVVRDALGAAIPAAGVGCGFARGILARLAALRGAEGESGPFAAECLTEDYELGWLVTALGGRSVFLRARGSDGRLIATRSFFPATLTEAVRQKTRWVHGIAFQSWDRLGWSRRPLDIWMALRDRRGPLTAVVLAAAYLLLVIETVLLAAQAAGWQSSATGSSWLGALLAVTLVGCTWRAAMRFAFTTREYGLVEGLRAVLRIPVSNIISIMAGRRAVMSYVRSLRGIAIQWDKTAHHFHPVLQPVPEAATR